MQRTTMTMGMRGASLLVGLMLSQGGCAYRIKVAQLETEVKHTRSALTQSQADRMDAQQRAERAEDQLTTANEKLADAEGRAKGLNAHVTALTQQLADMKGLVHDFRLRNEVLVQALEKAWSKKGGRSLVKDWLRVHRAGGHAKIVFDSCKTCP